MLPCIERINIGGVGGQNATVPNYVTVNLRLSGITAADSVKASKLAKEGRLARRHFKEAELDSQRSTRVTLRIHAEQLSLGRIQLTSAFSLTIDLGVYVKAFEPKPMG